MSWLALDIGGANLKAANAEGWAYSTPFALWRNRDGLATALAGVLAIMPEAERLAVTMTGELCDCYRTKTEGVRHILLAVREIAGSREVHVYLTDGRLVTWSKAHDEPLLAAASNWRALAEFACRFVPGGEGLLIDIGSTTTDVIPISAGQVAAQGRTDTERLASRELIYSGVGRTPICAIVQQLPWRDAMCSIASELFATTADAYIILGDICEDSSATWTADRRPLTREFARERLARQICEDAANLSDADFRRIAEFIRATQRDKLTEAIAGTKQSHSAAIVLSGSGEFLARRAAATIFPDSAIMSLAAEIGPEISRSAAAYALAVLAPTL
jgi:(4-(4-[2-(gamma-L-glutamylamino)ethyl]phenoxymethyl)furan-2-yl)methanamine synthase